MKYFVYAISSLETKYLYVGLTKDINQRFYRHNKGWCKTTKFYSPFKLTFLIEVDDRITARLLEQYFKSGCGKEFLKLV